MKTLIDPSSGPPAGEELSFGEQSGVLSSGVRGHRFRSQQRPPKEKR